MAITILFILTSALAAILGQCDVLWFRVWPAPLAFGLAVLFIFTGLAHFGRHRADFVAMVPPSLPAPGLLVALTGVFELIGAVAIVVPATRSLAAWSLACLLLAMFPANVSAAQRGLMLRGRRATGLLPRTLMQLLFLASCVWVAIGSR